MEFETLSPEEGLVAIEQMSREDMCRLWRFAKPGHPIFAKDTPLWEAFIAKFNELGGFNPEISKKIGWDNG